MSNNKYTAITIGPIYKTIHQVKSTKAIWAASYMFSYLIKQLIKKTKTTADDVIIPYFENTDLTDKTGVGLFPDRILFKKAIPNIDKLIDEVIKEFADKVALDIKKSQTDVEAFLKDYLHFSYLNIDVDINDNAIFKLNEFLDTIELKNKIIVNANEDFLIDFFEKTFYNFLIKEEFKQSQERFPSTIEIAMGEFRKNESDFKKCVIDLFKNEKGTDKVDNQQKFIEKIYSIPDFELTKRNYQKYIAVVQADGDNVGAFIKALYEEKDKDYLIQEFSKNLLQFSKESVKLINDYKGTPIYAGGDDLLFICPVAHSTYVNTENEKPYVKIDKSVITLINQIDAGFKKLFIDDIVFKPIIDKALKKPSMSYGVSISYYKFPLNQALEQGVNQLFYKAKKTCAKNAVSFAILKHSGQFMGTLFHKNRTSYEIFEKLITTKVSDDNYVKSITYKLENLEAVLFGIGCVADIGIRNSKFDNFFENNYNESVHVKRVNGKNVLIDFLEQTKSLMKAIYTENPIFSKPDETKKKAANKDNLNQIYASLRFIDFINNKEER